MNNVELQIVQKDTKTYTINVKRNGVGVSIVGWSIYFTVKTSFEVSDASALISVTVVFPNNAESLVGVGYLPLTSTNTNIAIGTYVYDMKFVDTGYRETFLRGKINIVPSARNA
jgi:hypothetical protein